MSRIFTCRKTPLAGAVLGLAVLAAAAAPARADRQPNTNVGAAERSAYQTAIDLGTPEALRHYLDSYPDSPQAAKLLERLIQTCSSLLQSQGASGAKSAADACDLSELISPAAGPGTPGVTGFNDPPTENSGGNRASPN